MTDNTTTDESDLHPNMKSGRTPVEQPPKECRYEYYRTEKQVVAGQCFLHPDTCGNCLATPVAPDKRK